MATQLRQQAARGPPAGTTCACWGPIPWCRSSWPSIRRCCVTELRNGHVLAFPAHALAVARLAAAWLRCCAQATGFDASGRGGGRHRADAQPFQLCRRATPNTRAWCRRARDDWTTGRAVLRQVPPARSRRRTTLGCVSSGMRTEIARSLPIECLYLMLRDRPLNVVGGMSTTLLTAGLLMPQVRCAALVHATPSGDAWDPRLLDATAHHAAVGRGRHRHVFRRQGRSRRPQ